MRFLSPTEVLFLHHRVIEETGGSHGLRDLGLLEGAVARPEAAFAGEEAYAGPLEKAAALFHSLVLNHPFVDGNKRTGFGAAVLLLQLNGMDLEAPTDEVVGFCVSVARGQQDVAAIAQWLRRHARSTP